MVKSSQSWWLLSSKQHNLFKWHHFSTSDSVYTSCFIRAWLLSVLCFQFSAHGQSESTVCFFPFQLPLVYVDMCLKHQNSIIISFFSFVHRAQCMSGNTGLFPWWKVVWSECMNECGNVATWFYLTYSFLPLAELEKQAEIVKKML